MNFIELFYALDRKLSIYEVDPDFSETKVHRVKQLILKEESIPKGIHIFRLGENENNIVISDKLKNMFEDANLTGIDFEQIDVS